MQMGNPDLDNPHAMSYNRKANVRIALGGNADGIRWRDERMMK
jgi:hypothetical protein